MDVVKEGSYVVNEPSKKSIESWVANEPSQKLSTGSLVSTDTVNDKLFEEDAFPLVDSKASEADQRENCGERFVFTERDTLVTVWSVVLLLVLIYVGTIFLFRFAFLTFHLDETGINPLAENMLAWNVWDYIVDALFWFDLIFNFFLSFEDARGHEVKDMWRIAKRYLKGRFWFNLLACLPTEAAKGIVHVIFHLTDTGPSTDLGVIRIFRLHRMTRLSKIATRMARLASLAKLAQFKIKVRGWEWFKSLRGVRVMNFLLKLMFISHLMACGWYLTAALHNDPSITWVGRRKVVVDGEERPLLGVGPVEQWMTSMYFILTVFTTVGFGDISAGTEAEIVYIVLTMFVGAVVHSIIISEVIEVVTSTSRTDEFIQKQTQLLEAFSCHANLDPKLHDRILVDLKRRSRLWAGNTSFDKEELKTLLLSKYMPRSVISQLPQGLHCGQLCKNIFLQQEFTRYSMPARLPSLMAIHLISVEFMSGEIIYQLHDFAFYLSLVLDGVFACVGFPGSDGGRDAMSFSWGSSRSFGHDKGGMPARQLNEEQGMSKLLFPYRLFGPNSYVGDLECITSTMRRSTVRCERSGKMLILKKPDLFELINEFPHYGELWAAAAWRRESLRKKALKQLKAPLNYHNFAVIMIQRFIRKKQAEWRRRPAEDVIDVDEAAAIQPRRVRFSTLPNINLLACGEVAHEFSHQELKQMASPAQTHTLAPASGKATA
jgi:CRP-like cAMP-binding protein